MDDFPQDPTNGQFLFQEKEFEGAEFDAAQFVARYRRVTTLESLREQLVNYNGHMQKQLYAVINRDYKDFITITTKLDGLDTRAEMMVKPLFGLQMDLSSLQNGISGSLHLIQDKLDQQRDIVKKKSAIKKLLRVSSNMDLAKSAMNISNAATGNSLSDAPTTISKRNRLYRQRSIPIDSQEKDLFVCSEFERAAISLRESQEDLEAIAQDISLLHNTFSPAMLQDLQRNFSTIRDSLISSLKTHLEHYFSAAATSTGSSSSEKDKTSAKSGALPLRCYAHCLRALLYLHQGEVAEAALRAAVIEPYLRNAFSVGKVDGKKGRGTFSGLDSALQEYITWIAQSQLPQLLRATEENVALHAQMMQAGVQDKNDLQTNNGNTPRNKPQAAVHRRSPLNLIVHSIWSPVIALLQERFPSMLSVGLTSVFSHCFRAIDVFAQHLLQTYPASCSRDYGYIDAYYQTWKIDLYVSLRTREVMTRLDAVCDLQLGRFGSSLKGDLLQLAYTASTPSTSTATLASENGSQGGQDVSSTQQQQLKNRLNTSLSLEPATLTVLQQRLLQSVHLPNSSHSQIQGQHHSSIFHHDLYRVLAMEILILVHAEVSLRPLTSHFLSLAFRVLQRGVYHVAFVCNSNNLAAATTLADSDTLDTPAVFSANHATGKDFEALRNQYLSANNNGSATTNNTTAVAESVVAQSTEDLLRHVQDLIALHRFVYALLRDEYLGPRLVHSSSSSASPSTKSNGAAALVDRLLQQGLLPILHVAQAIWHRVLLLTAQDCKRPLATAVKAIAGKFRIPKNPAPTQPSLYATSILTPLEQLLAQQGGRSGGVEDVARQIFSLLRIATGRHILGSSLHLLLHICS